MATGSTIEFRHSPGQRPQLTAAPAAAGAVDGESAYQPDRRHEAVTALLTEQRYGDQTSVSSLKAAITWMMSVKDTGLFPICVPSFRA